jgi:hypothetical protein
LTHSASIEFCAEAFQRHGVSLSDLLAHRNPGGWHDADR